MMSERLTEARTILVVEDNDETRELLTLFLGRRGYRVVTAEDGEQAVETAARERPDLIVMDLNLPKLDGFNAAKRIRQLPELGQVPIIANSAYGRLGIEFVSRDAELGEGYSDYFTKPLGKPFDLNELDDLLNRLLPPPTHAAAQT
jgi:CheY-like chemotaxis protein